MKKILLCLAVILALSPVSQAVMVTQVEVVAELTLAVTADYGIGTVVWGGGASGIVYYSDGSSEPFSGSAVVVGQVAGAVDQSVGTLASAVFSGGGLYGVLLNDINGKTFSISGDILTQIWYSNQPPESVSIVKTHPLSKSSIYADVVVRENSAKNRYGFRAL